MFLALGIISSPLSAQRGLDQAAFPDSSLDSMVLVLNLISSTHARPATGIVLARSTPGPALVMVSADFVGEGDEIIVLDGGNDIERHGRATRTAARSTETGLAVLEVEGLERPGIQFSADSWPAASDDRYEFAAWPAASALAEGESILRQAFSLEDIETLPLLNGPVFDVCGGLVGFRVGSDSGRLVAGDAVADFLSAWGMGVERLPCLEQPVTQNEEPLASGEQALLEEQHASEPHEAEMSVRPSDIMPDDKLSTLSLTRDQKWGLAAAWVVLAILAMFEYVRRQKKKEGHFIILTGIDADGRGAGKRIRLKLRPEHSDNDQSMDSLEAVFEHDGRKLTLRLGEQGIMVGMPENHDVVGAELAVAGTACLAGERFLVRQGQHIRLGNETFSVRLDVIGPNRDRPGK